MADLAVPAAPPLATIPGVELVQAGQWDISTGRVTFTPQDLAAAVGALDCAAVRRPVLKLGHVDPRFDGEPAVGWVDNMALADDGNTIVGDYVGMPAWLGDIIASAYPDRSIEGVFDFRCQIGHTHPFVLTGVALLGVTAPGVGTLQSLQDVAALYGVAASTTPAVGHAVAVHCKGAPMPNPSPALIAAGVTTEDVRRAYYEAAPWSVWITEMQIDPPQLITMDDDTGKRYRVPISIDGDAFTFGDPVEVAIQYVDKPTSTPAAASAAVVFASRAESRPGTRPAAAPAAAAPEAPPVEPAAGPTPSEQGGAPMPTLDEGLRERLGLNADADEATILAALDEALSERADPPATDPAPTPEPVAASLPPGVVMVDSERLAQLEQQAAEGVAARAQQRTEARDRALTDAIKAGKFPPARRDHWARLWDADPDGTQQTLASLAEGTVPLADIGEPGGAEDGNGEDAEFDRLFSTPGRS